MFGRNRISGKLMDAVLIPDAGSQPRLLVLTDGSFEYLSTTKRPGKEVKTIKGLFCKTYLYHYDPMAKAVLQRQKTKYDSLPPDCVLIPIGHEIWEVPVERRFYTTHLRVLDAKTGQVIMTQNDLAKKFPELASGILRIVADVKRPPYLKIYTKDGRTLIYGLEQKKLYSDKKDFLKSLDSQLGEIKLFVLADPSGGARKRLFLVTGPAFKLYHASFMESYFAKLSLLESFYDARAEELARDKVFLEGWIAYQDQTIALIVHQDQVGSNSPRRITCVDAEGKVLWTLPQKDLFQGLELSANDAYSVKTFVQDRLRVKRHDSTLLIVFKPKGFMGVDIRTGRILWKEVI
ncbi:MAG: hypothetical protein GXP49_02575 [Deltaproteobacteria bacterium]|nr:hypothetical protein [Deltaproteobacteria bacterium]